MSDLVAEHARSSRKERLHRTIALIIGVWIVSDIGYYFALPAIVDRLDYNVSPVSIALYYIFWNGVAIITFWPVYVTWPIFAKWTTFDSRLVSVAIWTIAFVGAVAFALYVIPALPQFDWREEWGAVPELPLATPLYFLPKSIEIIFQQLLIVAFVLALAAEQYKVRTISIFCAALFGSAHILLAFSNVSWGYVARFSVLATAFGLLFPYLILRVQNGLAYSYIMHWAYYAFTIFMSRVVGPTTMMDFWQNLWGGS